MLKPLIVTRRVAILGGLTFTLTGCPTEESGGGGGGSGGGGVSTPPPDIVASDPCTADTGIPDSLVAFAANVEFLAGFSGFLGSAFGYTAIGRILTLIGGAAGWVDDLDRFIQQQNRRAAGCFAMREFSPLDLLISPAYAATPTYAPGGNGLPPSAPRRINSGEGVNNLAAVSFVSGQSVINVTGTNTTQQDFTAHNVYVIVRSIGQRPPATAAEVLGPGGTAFVMSMPVGQTMTNPVNLELSPNSGFAVYSWCVPVDVTLTDDIVQREAMVGPIVYSVDPYNYPAHDAIRSNASATLPKFAYGIPQRAG